MALLSISGLEKSFGAREVLKDLSLCVERGDRLGLIGRNGCGKTTLLNIIAGREEADRGELHFARDLKVAWLEQNPRLDPQRTAWDEARTALADLEALQQRLAEWHHKLADAPGHHLGKADAHAMALDEESYTALDGHSRERRLKMALDKLGLNERLSAPCGQLSGGEGTRLALAKCLAAPFDLLILDEPTNHLDITGIEWLQSVLLETARTFILVSHDRAFLDAAANKVAELEGGKLTVISGNYSQFIAVKAERLTALRREATLEARFLAKEMDFIRRFMNSQRTKEAKGRLKRLERREAIEAPRDERTFHVSLKGGETHADVVLSVSELSQRFGERSLFENLSLELTRGEKIGIVGPNGSGKTTLARVLLGLVPPSAGRVRIARQLRVGTFTQDLGHLRPERTVLEEYSRLVNPPNLNVARGPLGAYLFSGARVEQRVESLSGGERARLALCILTAQAHDVLVLDEPTNHLDIPSRQALEESLAVYPGTCLIISHDRRFLDRVTGKTLWLDGLRTKLYSGSYSEAREQHDAALQPELDALESKAEREKKQTAAAAPPRRKKINAYKLNQIETHLNTLQARKAELSASLYDEAVFRDGRKVAQVSAELEQIEIQLLELNQAWEAVIDAADE